MHLLLLLHVCGISAALVYQDVLILKKALLLILTLHLHCWTMPSLRRELNGQLGIHLLVLFATGRVANMFCRSVCRARPFFRVGLCLVRGSVPRTDVGALTLQRMRGQLAGGARVACCHGQFLSVGSDSVLQFAVALFGEEGVAV